jgi:hypothetical protein
MTTKFKLESFYDDVVELTFALGHYLDSRGVILKRSGPEVLHEDLWVTEIAESAFPREVNVFFDFEIVTIAGHKTRKAFHVGIYRMPSGRLELTAYIL